MGFRETLEKKKPIAIGLASLVIVASAIAIFVQAGGMGPEGQGDAYFTVDDGKTFFEEDGEKRTPFDYKGQQAVRAHVFECGGKRIVGYMSRYSQDAIKTLDEASEARKAGKAPPNIGKLSQVAVTGMEYKKPGTDKWVSAADTAAVNVIRIFRCPDGSGPAEQFPK